MTPFEEALYRFVQECKESSDAFTSPEEDSASEMQLTMSFARKWDFKDKYEQEKKKGEELEQQLTRDRDTISSSSIKKMVREIIPIIDEMFILKTEVDKLDNRPLQRGAAIILENMEALLTTRNGSIIRPCVGEEFNPAKHKAISAEEVAGQRTTVISEVLRYGYSVCGQVVREAEVKVRCGLSG